ncbi:rhodanese-like domain-containing protein [Sulfurimonas autotrophica]|uniref:Rhodanese domain protein n=1 Tax=Sulfurimonas autotrophica (strain ATCC BAA-671 / DSM 16294 / JCM 11897 / OK10) TaxID=563040 RepID=E0UTG6_SULAO|nr:rhodanese-like domain-containing protein [Sulfurimonas autotrophica]ADN09331.1 Rhodanese domain protein [Sulfurimonas autotrophica DSM 16294]
MNHNEQMKEYYKRCDIGLIKGHLKELLTKAKEEIKQIKVEDIDLENMVLIDVREADEFASGVIPAKSIFTIPRGKIEFAVDDKLVNLSDHQIVCYCLKGARGLMAAKTLKDLGFSNVVNLEGGIESWVNAGKEIKNYLGYFTLCTNTTFK